MGSPVKASGYQVGQPGYTHASGEDNLWLLKDILGKSETEINKLKESKVVS